MGEVGSRVGRKGEEGMGGEVTRQVRTGYAVLLRVRVGELRTGTRGEKRWGKEYFLM
jgi:hypothetical protein